MAGEHLVLLDVNPADAEAVHALAAQLRDAGRDVETLTLHDAQIDPHAVLRTLAEAYGDGGKPRVIGAGLGGSLALALAALDTNERVEAFGNRGAALMHTGEFVLDGVVAVCPFMGFDALFYRRADLGREGFHRWRLRLARLPLLRGMAHHVASWTPRRLGCWSTRVVSWGRLAQCIPGPAMVNILGGVKRPVAVVLDGMHPELNGERAKMQIPAMNGLASAIIMPLGGNLTIDAVNSALSELSDLTQRVHV